MLVNADNVSVVKQLASVTEEPSAFMTNVEVKAMLRKENETALICLDLKPPYFAKAPAGCIEPTFQRFDGWNGSTQEHVVRFLDSKGPFAHDDLCLGEFSKSMIDRAYTWYVSPKPGSIHDWELIVSLFNTKLFTRKQSFIWLSGEPGDIHEKIWIYKSEYFTRGLMIVVIQLMKSL